MLLCLDGWADVVLVMAADGVVYLLKMGARGLGYQVGDVGIGWGNAVEM